MAKLRFYHGTMASAKSLRLLTTAYNFEEKGLSFMVLKPACDTRDGEDVISSRVGLKRECILIQQDVNLYKAVEEYNNILKAKEKYSNSSDLQFDYIKNNLMKGTKVAIDGSIQTRIYEIEGQKRYSTDIIVNKIEICSKKDSVPINKISSKTEVQETFNYTDEDLPW